MRVIKLGGSLLAWHGLPDAFHAWSQSTAPCPSVVVAGGGELAECLRRRERQYVAQPESAAQAAYHWWAVEAMEMNAAVTSGLLGLPLIDQPASLTEFTPQNREGVVVVSPRAYYSPELNNTALPIGWETTGDSIALFLATVLRARELVLLKSADAPSSEVREWSAAGYVDRVFADLLSLHSISVQAVNLRTRKAL